MQVLLGIYLYANNLRVPMCVNEFISTFVWVNEYVSVWPCLSTVICGENMWVHWWVWENVWITMYRTFSKWVIKHYYICEHSSLSIFMSPWICEHECDYMCLWMWACWCESVNIWISPCVWTFMPIHRSLLMWVYLCSLVNDCVFIFMIEFMITCMDVSKFLCVS